MIGRKIRLTFFNVSNQLISLTSRENIKLKGLAQMAINQVSNQLISLTSRE